MTTTSYDATRIDSRWWSWEGMHGGWVAGAALTAVRDSFAGGAQPVRSLTTHFLAPVGTGPLSFSGTAPATGRRTSTCLFTGHQDGEPVVLGSALFGPSRPGPAYSGLAAPEVPEPDDCLPLELPADLAPFARQLEIRPGTGDLPLAAGPRAELVAWVRFRDDRPLDAPAVTTLTDVLPPALYAHWSTPRPVPTAELTVHFSDALDDGSEYGWSLVRIRCDHAGGGWAVDDSAVWSRDRNLLAVARQARVVRGPTPPQTAAGTVNS
ncbi:thioesterase family protein [Streptomyces sp. RO-S4]|uniref:acyl-CoA thioesterase n=1 Tax=unclassified Streptomyces TaxID=2593676 RepID=UPI00208DF9EE|nr:MULTISPECIES: thioesterase family protein [unclassified Streptomyces]MCO4696077.1 thioesterase family protein [Streptomyces sp. RO-S4]MDU0299195.1 thioesterase family protein [Streptomyces sp. PAL114]